MTGFELLADAAVKGNPQDVLSFGGYRITGCVSKPSQQGLVVFAESEIGKRVAIKFYRPREVDLGIAKEGRRGFINEVKILATLSHRNIVNVQAAGSAVWDAAGRKWLCSRNLGPGDAEDVAKSLYYVMDFIEGKDIAHIFGGLATTATATDPGQRVVDNVVRAFEDMVRQISHAMAYYHSKGVTHKDIKPDNIRYSTVDETFVVVDFGFAHHIQSPDRGDTIRRTDFMDWPSIERRSYRLNDLAQFAKICMMVLKGLKGAYDSNRYQGMSAALERATAADLDSRYQTADGFYAAVSQYFVSLPQWRLDLSLNETLCPGGFGKFVKKLRIPYSGSTLIADEVERLIDTPEFQRLRGVRQLGPTMFVFPGANHTRYEHSLGTYHLSLKYLQALLNWPGFRETCDQGIDEAIKLTALSALLHDVGHYPYSHWIEEIDEFVDAGGKAAHFPTHEDRARIIIDRSELGHLIEERWRVDPATVADIISRRALNTDGKKLISSVIDSPLDVDKLDYLVRDAIHCGVDYGKGIDVERLLDSLCVLPGSSTLGVTDKGLSCLTSLLTCRNVMYHEVYWHKTVRAADAMFKRFVYEYVRRGISEVSAVEAYFELPDDQFIASLLRRCTRRRHAKLAQLMRPFAYKGRALYKPAYIFYADENPDEDPSVQRFFSQVLRSGSYQALVRASEALADALRVHIPEIDPLDILLEHTPVREQSEKWQMAGIPVWDIRKARLLRAPMLVSNLDNYLWNSARAYLFCSPEHYQKLRDLASTSAFLDVLVASTS